MRARTTFCSAAPLAASNRHFSSDLHTTIHSPPHQLGHEFDVSHFLFPAAALALFWIHRAAGCQLFPSYFIRALDWQTAAPLEWHLYSFFVSKWERVLLVVVCVSHQTRRMDRRAHRTLNESRTIHSPPALHANCSSQPAHSHHSRQY